MFYNKTDFGAYSNSIGGNARFRLESKNIHLRPLKYIKQVNILGCLTIEIIQ